MTDPRDPHESQEPREPGSPAAGSSPPEEPHGLVEDIKHEIEEVVEHVPPPLRWTVGKLLRLAILVLVGLVVVVVVTAVLYVSNRTEWAARELALLVNQALASRSDVTIEIGDIKGNPFTGVQVLTPRVMFRSGDQPPLLEAPEMRLRYSAWALATGGRGPIVIDLERPVFRLGRGEDGKLRLPAWNTPPARGPARVRELLVRIHDGTFHAPDSGHVMGLELDARATLGPETRLDVRSLRWARGPFGSVLENCVLDYAGGDSARLRVQQLRTADLALKGNMAWKPKSGEAITHLEVERLRWRWLYRVTGNQDFDVPGEGRVTVDARGGQVLAGRFEASGVWDSLAADVNGGFVWRDGRLRVEPLQGRSLAGDLNGTLLWAGKSWEISADVKKGDPSRWKMIGIRNWPAGNLNGHFRYAVETRRLKHAWLSARLSGSEWARWRADSGTVAMDFTPVGPDSFTVRTLRRGGVMTLRALTDSTGWHGDYTLTRFPLDEWPDGRASGLKGTLATGRGGAESHRGNLRVTGTLEGSVTDWLGIHTARWRMSEMRGSLLPVPDLDAQVKLEDLFFLTVHWDSASVPLHVGDRTVTLPSLAAFAGDTVVRLAGRADWEREGWTLTADSASMRSSQFHWIADPPLALSGDPHGVSFDRLLARDGDARLAIEGRWAGPGGYYDWTARAERLDLARLGFPTAWRLAGAGDAQLRVTGVAGDPRWELRGNAHAPGMGGHRVDSLVVLLAGGPSRLEVRDARAMLDGGTLSAAGEVSGTAPAWPDTLTGVGFTRWVASADRWTGEVRADRLALDRLGSVAGGARALRGRASGKLEIGGRPAAPELTWNADAQLLSWGDYLVDAMAAHGRYGGEQLDVTELTATRRGVVSTITGSMPLRLEVGRRPEIPEKPLDLRVDIPSGDLALLPLFVPQIGSAAGKFDLSAHLGGTARHPDLTGHAHIREGRGRVAGREEVVEDVTANLTLDEARITLDTLSARQRKRRGGTPGMVRASGWVDLTGLALKGYQFNVEMRDFAAVEPGIYGAEFDGRFVVTNEPVRAGRPTLPVVVGGVELRRATVVFDFANQSQVQMISAATKPLYWLYRIQLSATDRLRWQPPDADIEFSADLRLEQTRDSLIIYGDMTALRGTYYYLSNKFTMERVNLTFDNVGGVDPKLDIVAVTQVPKSALGARGPGVAPVSATGNDQIRVAITGRAAEPVMTFTSEGDADQSQILAALTYGRARSDQGRVTLEGSQATAINFADDWVTRNLNRQLSADLSRLFQGYLNDWAVERESGGLLGGQGDVIVGVSAPLSPNLNVRYRQRVAGFSRPGETVSANPLERDVAAEYRINRFFYVSSELAQRRTATGTTAAGNTIPEFNVNLKARWEY